MDLIACLSAFRYQLTFCNVFPELFVHSHTPVGYLVESFHGINLQTVVIVIIVIIV